MWKYIQATGNCVLKKGQELQHFVCGGVLPERRQVLNWGSGGQLSESPPSPLLRQIHMAAGRLLTEVLTCFSQTRIPAGKYSGQSHPDKQHWNLNHGVFKLARLEFKTTKNSKLTIIVQVVFWEYLWSNFSPHSVPVPNNWNDSHFRNMIRDVFYSLPFPKIRMDEFWWWVFGTTGAPVVITVF